MATIYHGYTDTDEAARKRLEHRWARHVARLAEKQAEQKPVEVEIEVKQTENA